MNNEKAPILTVEEICRLLNIGKNAAYKLLTAGELQGFKIGRIWKIPRDSLEKYISERKKK